MKASELIEKLNKIITEKGDIPVETFNQHGVEVVVNHVEVFDGVTTPFIQIQ